MPTLLELKEQHTALALEAHQIVSDDSKTGSEIREALDKIEPDIHALQEQIKDAEYVEGKRQEYPGVTNDAGGETPPDQPPPEKSSPLLGDQLVDSDAFKAAAERMKATGRIDQIFELKGTLDRAGIMAALTESGLTGPNFIQQDRQPGILPILFQQPTVADLMPNGTTTSNTIRYAKESTATNAASTVAEEGTKPEAALNFTVVDDPVKKIAVILKASDEILDDEPQMRAYVNGRLVLFVRIREDQQLLTGNPSVAANDITGLLNRSGLTAAQALGADTIAVAVHKEITKIRVASFLDPTGIVWHPNDEEAAMLEQDSNNQFFGMGPFTGPYGQAQPAMRTYWGLPTVSTQAMTENTILVGAFATAAQIFRRTGITVEVTNSNEDDFKNNLVAFRAEERLALAVYRPSAFGTVTGV